MIGISGVVITWSAGQAHAGVAHWLLWVVGIPVSVVLVVIGSIGLERTRTLISEEVQAVRAVSTSRADATDTPTFRSQADKRRFVARYGPKWGVQAATLMHRRNNKINLAVVCLSATGALRSPWGSSRSSGTAGARRSSRGVGGRGSHSALAPHGPSSHAVPGNQGWIEKRTPPTTEQRHL